MAVHPAREAWQAGVVGVVLQVRRNQGEHRAVAVALILLRTAEQIVVDAEIDRGWVVVQCALGTLPSGLRRGDEVRAGGERQGQGQPCAGEHHVQSGEKNGAQLSDGEAMTAAAGGGSHRCTARRGMGVGAAQPAMGVLDQHGGMAETAGRRVQQCCGQAWGCR
ncbi:hypothetical protein D3C81_1439010 [compost metagenome]